MRGWSKTKQRRAVTSFELPDEAQKEKLRLRWKKENKDLLKEDVALSELALKITF